MKDIFFFDKYPNFYGTDRTDSHPTRINKRYLGLIYANKEIIKGSRILDIGSHDGRWSFSAIKNGATHVIGVEGRGELIKLSHENMEIYNIPKHAYSFVVGDICSEIKKIKRNSIDIVFCFGYFYHTMAHVELLTEIKRLNPKYIIFDTRISASNLPIIEVTEEDSEYMGNAISVLDNKKVIVGYPSKIVIELMLNNLGFDYRYCNWNELIEDFKGMEVYETMGRVTIVAKNLQYEQL